MLNYAPMASVTYFVVVVFDRENGDLRPGEPQEVRSAEAERRRVVSLAGAHAGVVAFSRSGDPATGEFTDAEILNQRAMSISTRLARDRIDRSASLMPPPRRGALTSLAPAAIRDMFIGGQRRARLSHGTL
jgi:hypothetical protein